jgi:hypothetical protein
MGPFQNCVRQRRPVSKMAAITKNRNFFKWPKLLYFKPERAVKIGKSSKFIKNPVIYSSSLCLCSSNLGTFWLKIEQFWPFEEISIFSNDGHLMSYILRDFL